MIRLLVLAGLALGILDPILLFKIGMELGPGAALALLIVPGLVGGRLARHQGYRCLQRVQELLNTGQMPSAELASGILILLAGVLMVYPGPISTLSGLILLIPLFRRLIAGGLLARWQRALEQGAVRTAGEVSVNIGASEVPGGGGLSRADAPKGLKTVEGEELESEPLTPESPPSLPPA